MSEPHFQNISNYQSKKNEEFMSNAQIEHFKTKLNVWKDQLIDDAKTTITHIQEDSSKVADINDRATLEEEFALELRTRDRERKLISKIEATLHIIELGDYGYCKTCGAEPDY
jgi:DnaK suppressor protein